MKFIFHNPHESNMYLTPISFFREKRKSVEKYSHLLFFFLEKFGRLDFYIDSYNFKTKLGLKKIFPKLLGVYIWAIFNKINPFRIRLITSPDEISQNDVIFTFLYPNFTNQNKNLSNEKLKLNEEFSKINAFKIIHFSHFNYNSKYASENLKKLKIDLIVAENNLKLNSDFFNYYFKWFKKDFLVLPFVPKDRFINKRYFSQRINKALATGTITHPMDQDFIDFFGHSDLHPMRKNIHDNQGLLVKHIDSFISPIIENKDGNKNDSQKKYFSFDIVEKYNEYKMFIVPEEISGLPGIGFVEGMKCGSAFIGIKSKMYEDLGLIDKVNYIAYNGTLKDLVIKISYYQKHPQILEMIAESGEKHVTNNFTKEKVGETILEYLRNSRKNKT